MSRLRGVVDRLRWPKRGGGTRSGSHLFHSVRVAAMAALLIAVLYVALAVTFDLIDSRHLVGQIDSRLSEHLSDVKSHGIPTAGSRSSETDVVPDSDVDTAPVVLWQVDRSGRAIPLSDGAPPLPSGAWSKSGQPTSAPVGTSTFRLLAAPSGGGWLVAGQSLSDTEHVEDVLATAEIIAGPILVVAMFLGALAIGLRASGPVEQARRQQLEFTADASHELRTPLSVIEAEVGLSLSTDRQAPHYREALERIGGESKRLRRIVEDLLWLARFDAEPPPPDDEPVDLATLAEVCTDRFSAVARSRGIQLSVARSGGGPAWIKAPPEWIDRLVGVLVDNACRYAGRGGVVRVSVSTHGNRVSLSVDDSGPGIPPGERSRLFDRFHRATTSGGGAGLGLAIADAVVRSTGGSWRVDDSDQGGAHFEVTWHRTQPRDPAAPPTEPRPTAPPPTDPPANEPGLKPSDQPPRPTDRARDLSTSRRGAP